MNNFKIGRIILSPLVGVTFGITVIICSFLIHELSNGGPNLYMLIISLGVVFAVCCYFLVNFIIFEIGNYKNIIFPYFRGEYQTVQGAVENLKYEKNGSCSFCVNGVTFNSGESGMYPSFYGDDRIIYMDTQPVTIGYITYKGLNLIVEIEQGTTWAVAL